MNTDAPPKNCVKCGALIPLDAPSGGCPACIFKGLLADEPDGSEMAVLTLRDLSPVGSTLRQIGDYELIEIIAHGGMGVVYKARQKKLNRTVALKLLLGGGHASDEFKKRFRREAELAAQLQHPNIVQIFEAGEHEGQPFYSMEYIAGRDLLDLTKTGPLSPDTASLYLATIAKAVHHAHLAGVLHRDLKPSNLLLGDDGRLMVTDFGLARRFDDTTNLTLTGTTLGTPGYQPPEQISGRHGAATIQSDIYSLGAVLYHLLTGRSPFESEKLADLLLQVLNEKPKEPSSLNPSIPPYLENICLRCLAKNPADRFRTALELAEALAIPSAEVRGARRVRTVARWLVRHRWRVLGAVLVLAAACLVPAAIRWQGASRTHRQIFEGNSFFPRCLQISSVAHGVKDGEDRLVNSNGSLIACFIYRKGVPLSETCYYPGGNLFEENAFVDGLRSGVETRYYPDGKVLMRSPYVGGQLNGTAESYYPDGTIYGDSQWSNGKLNGVGTTYLPDGRVSFLQYCTDGQVAGDKTVNEPSAEQRQLMQKVTDLMTAQLRDYWPNAIP